MRRTKEVTITAEGRDQGKKFFITEMHADQAERWADRAFLCLAHSGVDLPAGVERGGMNAIAQIAHLLGGIRYEEIGPLMDELLDTCVQFRGVSPQGQPLDRALIRDDTEEVATRQHLRGEALDLHVNFSLAAVILNLMAVASEMKSLPISGTTRTSRRRSGRS